MDNKKSDKYYFGKIINDINLIKEYVGNSTYEEYVSNNLLMDATMFRMIQLVECVKSISETFKNDHPQIKWRKIVGFRNGIVHEYGKTDYTIVYETITKSLNQLKGFLEQCL